MKKRQSEKVKNEDAAKAGTPDAFESAAIEAGYSPGTVEYEARVHWEREKAAYEERTGEKVEYEPPFDPGRTPVTSSASEPSSASDELKESNENGE